MMKRQLKPTKIKRGVSGRRLLLIHLDPDVWLAQSVYAL